MAKIPKFQEQQPPLKVWTKGERLTAADLNQNMAQLWAATKGAALPRQVNDIAPGVVARFRYVSVGTDQLVCRSWDDDYEGQVDVAVALPWLLRRTPFDTLTINGLTYTYSSNIAREVDDGTDTEDQTINPIYYEDDEIFAVRGLLRGTGVVDASGVDIGWLDLNVDGRAWAAPVT